MLLETSPTKLQPFCPGGNELRHCGRKLHAIPGHIDPNTSPLTIIIQGEIFKPTHYIISTELTATMNIDESGQPLKITGTDGTILCLLYRAGSNLEVHAQIT